VALNESAAGRSRNSRHVYRFLIEDILKRQPQEEEEDDSKILRDFGNGVRKGSG
jgi:hypothetical protein